MAYVDTPLAAQRLKDSQPQIRQNFIENSNLINVDHYTFGSPTAGEHKKVTLPDQGIAPVFPGNDVGLWSQIPTSVPTTGINELYVRRQDGTTTPITAKNATVTGWCYFPSGILLKWGSVGISGSNVPVLFPDDVNVTIPRFTTILNVTVSSSAAAGSGLIVNLVAGSATVLGFTANIFVSTTGTPGAGTLSYIAIGT